MSDEPTRGPTCVDKIQYIAQAQLPINLAVAIGGEVPWLSDAGLVDVVNSFRGMPANADMPIGLCRDLVRSRKTELNAAGPGPQPAPAPEPAPEPPPQPAAPSWAEQIAMIAEAQSERDRAAVAFRLASQATQPPQPQPQQSEGPPPGSLQAIADDWNRRKGGAKPGLAGVAYMAPAPPEPAPFDPAWAAGGGMRPIGREQPVVDASKTNHVRSQPAQDPGLQSLTDYMGRLAANMGTGGLRGGPKT
jgi:hypothetical protein